MFKITALAVGILGFAGAASAMGAPRAPIGIATSAAPGAGGIVLVGEGCGAGSWRASDGVCRPFMSPYGNRRGTRFECPPNWHIGPGGQRCWPNR